MNKKFLSFMIVLRGSITLLIFFFALNLVSAVDFGYNNLGVPQLPPEINYSKIIVNLTVNYSEYTNFWDFLDTPADINLDSIGVPTGAVDFNGQDIDDAFDIFAGNDIHVTNDLEVDDNVEIHGSTWIDEILNVTGLTYLYDHLFVEGNITVPLKL